MKKTIEILLFFLASVICMTFFSSCHSSPVPPHETENTAISAQPQTEITETDACTSHEYTETRRSEAMPLKDGEIEYTCTRCGFSGTETIPATKSVKVLALGNSFTVDSMEHLWHICRDAGIETVVLGNLYIGSCTLDIHWSNIAVNKPAYTFYKNVGGVWGKVGDFRVLDALRQEEWDYIVIHQNSGNSGFDYGFTRLDEIIGFFEENKTNPNAKLIWNMSWAFQSDSTHQNFDLYDQDQMKMYQTIAAKMMEQIPPRKTLSAIIPTGTALQNLRTSYIGDTLTRDGYHLSYGLGRYTAALTWYAVLSGGALDAVDWIPPKYPDVRYHLPAIKEAVTASLASPAEITASSFSVDPFAVEIPEPADPFDPASYLEGDRIRMKAYGIDPENYQLLPWAYLENSYWYSTVKTGVSTPGKTANTYLQYICSKKKYAFGDELPAGTVFLCDPGWKIRIEGFPSPSSVYTGTRPGSMTAPFYLLTEDSLDGCQYVTWNVSAADGANISQIYDEANVHVRVYIPIGQE